MPGSNGHAHPLLFAPEPLRLPALRMRQGRDRVLYAFAVDGKQVEAFAAVSRLARDQARRIVGYQRPEVLSHVAEIRAYLESDNPMLPNAVVVAFDPTVRFEPHPGADLPATASPGGSSTASSGWRPSARRRWTPSRCGWSGSWPTATPSSGSSSSW